MLKDSLTLAFITTTSFFILAFALGYIVHWCWPKENTVCSKKESNEAKEEPITELPLMEIKFQDSSKVGNAMVIIDTIRKFEERNEPELEKAAWKVLVSIAREYARKEPVKPTLDQTNV